MNGNEHHDLNEEHAKNPKIGDFWHDHLAPVLCVIDVGTFSVVVLRSTKPVDDDHWTWDISNLTMMTKKEFYRQLHYSTENMKHKCWASVVPERDKIFAKLVEENLAEV